MAGQSTISTPSPDPQDPHDPVSRALITFYETFTLENNRIPSLHESCQAILPGLKPKLAETKIMNLLESPSVIKSLNSRGLTPFPAHQDTPKGISPMQLAAIALVFDFNDFRPLHSKLKQLGLTTRQWNGWLRSNNRFSNLVRRRSEAAFGELLPTAQSGLAISLQKGDSSTLRLYYEIMGYHKSEGNLANLQAIQEFLAKTIEIIQQFVPDTAIQTKIAGELVRSLTNSDSSPIQLNSDPTNST